MKTLLQINSVINSGSTGRIAEDIGITVMKNGWDSYIAYGRYKLPSASQLIKIGNDCDIKLHGFQTRLFDSHGFGSAKATQKLIKEIEIIRPEIIHLHNLHGYYLNIEILFNYLKNSNIPVVWTLHDCWPITGHCSHFELIGCDKWKTRCHHCPQKKEYPASFFFDRSSDNYQQKKALFTSIKNLTVIAVSDWLASIINKSYLSKYKLLTVHNGIDLNLLKQANNAIDIRRRYNIHNSFMILGVATSWGNSKGLRDFVELSKCPQWQVVLIGIPNSLKNRLPSNIVTLSRTENQEELAEFYSAADVLVNPTYQDSFPTVNIEALACGTPVITYNTGGSPEAIDSQTGMVVEKGNIQELIKAIETIKSIGKEHYSTACRERAVKLYNKNDRYMDYINLYESLLENGK